MLLHLTAFAGGVEERLTVNLTQRVVRKHAINWRVAQPHDQTDLALVPRAASFAAGLAMLAVGEEDEAASSENEASSFEIEASR